MSTISHDIIIKIAIKI